ncbi:MAG: flagellar export protein FliJ [Bdellovibrionales bacterium]
MADLNPLIRVRRHALEQKQKALAALYRQLEGLQDEKTRMLEQLEQEQSGAAGMDVAMLAYLGSYAEGVKTRVQEIDEEALALNTRIDIAREDMRSAFAEVKKLEITQENREDEERREIAKKESDMLDEIGLETYRRLRDEG